MQIDAQFATWICHMATRRDVHLLDTSSFHPRRYTSILKHLSFETPKCYGSYFYWLFDIYIYRKQSVNNNICTLTPMVIYQDKVGETNN